MRVFRTEIGDIFFSSVVHFIFDRKINVDSVREKSTKFNYAEYLFEVIIITIKMRSLSFLLGITGNALPEDIDFFLSSGANQVVIKPLSRAKLMDALYSFVPMA